LREVIPLGGGDMKRLAGHLESIAKALSAGERAKARILGLYFPINRLTGSGLDRLRKASALLKGNFNPDEARDERGRWTTDTATAAPLSAPHGVQTRERAGSTRPLATNPGVRRVQEIVPVEPGALPNPPNRGRTLSTIRLIPERAETCYSRAMF
jgi:hypothetical protein